MFGKTGAKSVTLIRNPSFQQWSAEAQPEGFPNTIQWTFQPDDGKALTAIERGQADVMLDPPPANRLTELRTRYAVLTHPYAGESTLYLGLNSHVPPFSSRAARQALNFAIDRGGFSAFGGALTQTPTCQVLPPGMFGYSPDCPYTKAVNPKSGAWRAPDTKRADALVLSGTRDSPVQWVCSCLGASRPEAAFGPADAARLSGDERLDHRLRPHLTGHLEHAGADRQHRGLAGRFPIPFRLLRSASRVHVNGDRAIDEVLRPASGRPGGES
jgi:hypothetical protein